MELYHISPMIERRVSDLKYHEFMIQNSRIHRQSIVGGFILQKIFIREVPKEYLLSKMGAVQ